MWELSETQKARLLSYRHLVVGFSGGLDSTVLLHLLASTPALLEKLQALHIHHDLSAHADTWQVHCQTFCKQYHIPYTTRAVTLNTTSNLEATARALRYQVFNTLIGPADCLLLAHHANDQAETLLLNLLRGTGVEGLAAMPVERPFGEGVLMRPLLCQTREALQAYANYHGLKWVEDESNQETHFTRNYLRHEILPRLTSHFPGALQAINRCATHAQTATQHLNDLAHLDCPALALSSDTLALEALYDLSYTRLKQVIRVWLKQQHLKAPDTHRLQILLDEVVFAKEDMVPSFRLENVVIRRYRHVLYIVRDDMPLSKPPQLTQAMLASRGVRVPYGAAISVRFRSGGERMVWRGHTRTLKYIFQALGVPPWQRDTIPLIFIDNVLVAVLDCAIADGYHQSTRREKHYDTV
ncbi:MAG: tRNA lysidine(34) synthetase TilS [Legionellaceae bacterium]|nr:tRNA lysidine(34) synthetase TilS [Legionellaceae bacterium]